MKIGMSSPSKDTFGSMDVGDVCAFIGPHDDHLQFYMKVVDSYAEPGVNQQHFNAVLLGVLDGESSYIGTHYTFDDDEKVETIFRQDELELRQVSGCAGHYRSVEEPTPLTTVQIAHIVESIVRQCKADSLGKIMAIKNVRVALKFSLIKCKALVDAEW